MQIKNSTFIGLYKNNTNDNRLKTCVYFNNSKLIRSDEFKLCQTSLIQANNKSLNINNTLIKLLYKIKTRLNGNIIIVSGPSGVGKDTVINAVKKNHPELNSVISYTTRKKRHNEVEGVDYNFISTEEFKKLIASRKLFHYVIFNENYYGISSDDVNKKRRGTDVFLNLKAEDALKIKEKLKHNAILIFVSPPSLHELEKRLRDRGTEDEENIQKRLEYGKKQLELAKYFDFNIINETGKLDKASEQMANIINNKKDPMIKIIETIIKNLKLKS